MNLMGLTIAALNLLTALCIVKGIRDFRARKRVGANGILLILVVNDIRRDSIRQLKHLIILSHWIWPELLAVETVIILCGLLLGVNSMLDLFERRHLLRKNHVSPPPYRQ